MLGSAPRSTTCRSSGVRHYDVTFVYVGHAGGDAQIEVIGSLAKRDATVVYRHDGNVAAVLTVGRDQQSLEIEAALESKDWGAIDALLREIGAGG